MGTYTDPKGPCTQAVYTLGPMYLYREYFKANVYESFRKLVVPYFGGPSNKDPTF